MGCCRSQRLAGEDVPACGKYADDADVGPLPGGTPSTESAPTFPVPCDDLVTDVCEFGDREFVVSGVDGWVHVYDWETASLIGKMRAHKKSVNRLMSWHDRVFTASGDATVRAWNRGMECGHGGDGVSEPVVTLRGHEMSVRALDVLDRGDNAPWLLTGSRDYSVRLWDLETGTQLHQRKIQRNVVTAIRRVPGEPPTAVQASEDLQLRLWDARVGGLQPAQEAPGGPNQLICIDVSDDGRLVVSGSKGFSRENCEVKVFDLRSGLRQLAAVPCADQSIEAVRFTGHDRCMLVSRDGVLRGVAIPEASVVAERASGAGGYTALGVKRRPGAGPVALAAGAGIAGPELELLAWPDAALDSSATVLASAVR